MKIHEYQAKELLRRYGVPTPEGKVATTVEEAKEAARALGTLPVVVKAQIHAGGRGKGGGVKVAKTLEDADHWSSQILGMNLVTHQTGRRARPSSGCSSSRASRSRRSCTLDSRSTATPSGSR